MRRRWLGWVIRQLCVVGVAEGAARWTPPAAGSGGCLHTPFRCLPTSWRCVLPANRQMQRVFTTITKVPNMHPARAASCRPPLMCTCCLPRLQMATDEHTGELVVVGAGSHAAVYMAWLRGRVVAVKVGWVLVLQW